MFDNKKEDSDLSLPDLPSSNSSSFLPPIENPKHLVSDENLPELPNLSNQENKIEEIPPLNRKRENFKTIEMKEWTPEESTENIPDKHENSIPELPSHESQNPDVAPLTQHTAPSFEHSQTQQAPRQPITQDIFIKIDKFRDIRKALNDTQEKLEEIDSLLSKIRETKVREEQELLAWEKELSTAKSRINDITSNIFEKVR